MAFTETPWRGSWKGVLGVGRRLVLRRQRTEQALSRAVATSELVHFAPNPAGPFRFAWYQARPAALRGEGRVGREAGRPRRRPQRHQAGAWTRARVEEAAHGWTRVGSVAARLDSGRREGDMGVS